MIRIRFLGTISVIVFVAQFLSPMGPSEAPSLSARTGTGQDSLRHDVSVILKLVQIYVVDPEGKPARDLEKPDFILYDSGKLQTITAFEKHVLPAADTGPAENARAPEPEAAPLLNRKFFFLIDNGASNFEGLQKSKGAALEFLKTKVQPDDETALFTFSRTSGLTLHEYLTRDHEKVRAAIKKIRDLPGERYYGFMPVIDHVPMGMDKMSSEIFLPHANTAGARAVDFFSEVRELAKALRSMPGVKNIILFSKGWGSSSLKPSHPLHVYFVAMAKELASANAQVFSVNTTAGDFDKIVGGPLPEASLDYLSRLTGGKYFSDVNYSAQIAQDIQDATCHYYVLGYSIAPAWDGKFHDIKIEIRRPGYRVYGQRGYFNPLPFNKLLAVEKHLHLLDLALGEGAYSELRMNFPSLAVPFSKEEGANTLLLSEISVERIREAVGDRTEFISLVLDQNKAIVDGRRAEIDWSEFRAGQVMAYTGVALTPGRYECRTIIRNLDDGKGAVGACSVEIPEPPKEGLILFPPLLLVPGREVRYLNFSESKKNPADEGPSLFRIFPFPSKDYGPLAGEMEPGTKSLLAAVRSAGMGAGTSGISFSAWLEPEASGGVIPLTTSFLNDSPPSETGFHLLEFVLPELGPGRYVLHVRAEDEGAKSMARTSVGFIIRAPGPGIY